MKYTKEKEDMSLKNTVGFETHTKPWISTNDD